MSFFTSLVPARLVLNSTLGECAPWIFPCGLVIGALCTLASLAASILLTKAATCPDVIALLLAALAWILAELRITRALHWDGLADLADAIGSYKEGEAFRAVLKDSRIGTFGVLALICAFACELLAVAAHLHILSLTSVAALVLAPAWGRGMAVPLFCLASPHDITGLGGQFACAGTRDNLALSIILAALTLGFLALAGVHPLNLCALLLLQDKGIIVLDEGAGMGFSAVHRVRADACAALEEAVLAPHRARAAALDGLDIDEGLAAMRLAQRPGACTVGGTGPVICALATTLEAAEAARAAGATRLYLPTDVLDEAGVTPDEAQRRGLIPVLDEVSRACDLPRLDRWVLPGAPVAVGTISELALAAERGAAAELRSCIPVHNTLARDFLAAQGARGAWLSPELTLAELDEILPASPLVPGIMVYGRPRVMTSEHCILQVADACCHNCARCGLRRRELSLRNIDGKRFPVRTDAHGRSRLYTDRPVDLTPQLPQLIGAGVERLLVDGTLLSAEELSGEVARVRRALDAPRRGQRPGPREPGSFAGCLFVGVD